MDGRYSNQELANFLDQLMMDINHAYSKLQLYVHFQNKIESRIDAINLAPAFFTLTMDSLFNDVIIKVCKM